MLPYRWFVLMFASALAGPAFADLIPTSAAGDLATVTAARDAFRAAIGGGTVAGANGLFSDVTGSRREINWDGVPDNFADPNLLPLNFFNANSPRGAVFSTPGTGVEVSADSSNPTSTPVQFGSINPTYPDLFEPFSPQRLFTAIGSNIVDVAFFVPGTLIPATTTAFGVIFSDVDQANVTSITYFLSNEPPVQLIVPAAAGDETFSFLGASAINGELITGVRIVSGNAILQSNVIETGSIDLVAMDDFIYAEPRAVPEPSSWLLIAMAAAACMVLRGRRNRSA